MAMSPSPQLSPSLGAAHRIDRNHSDTPPQPLSKRDKKRTQLLDRLEEITQQFSTNKDTYYRSQLQALQIDIHLILQSEAYGNETPTDLGEDITQLVHRYTGGDARHMMAAGDASMFAGKVYSEFAADVAAAAEERDAALTRHASDYEKKLADLQNSNAFMMKLAEEEHKALSSTLRDRLINSVTGRKARLLKEKENLEIGDSNALLMHPNQFNIANPSSPGGIHGKRATRHRRDLEDLPGFPESHKRKRRAAEDAESPAPHRRLVDNGINTPIWTGDLGKSANRSGSPLYSIEKLFTEKELTMTYNTAAIAAHYYIVSHKTHVNEGSPQNGSSNSNSGNDDHDADNEEGIHAPDSPPMMERQISHATRSTRGGINLGNFTTGIGIDMIGDLSQPGNFARIAAQLPKMPPPLSVVMQKPYNKDTANSPMGVSYDEATRDMHRIEQSKDINANEGLGASLDAEELKDRLLLGAAVSQPGTYAAFIPIGDGGTSGKGKSIARNLQLEDGFGGVAMSKQSSLGGSDGGATMSRAGTHDRRRRA